MRPELETVLNSVAGMAAGELPALLGELEVIRATATLRMTAPAPKMEPDELLDVATAARRLGISEDYLYRHHSDYGFTRRQGRKLLFSSRGIEQYISRKR